MRKTTARDLMQPQIDGAMPSSLSRCSALPLILDRSERRIRGFDMPPLLKGEIALLSYLGARPYTWHSSDRISLNVYCRQDAGARQLVWKYASTLRKKLSVTGLVPSELCRRRGYSCRVPIGLSAEDEA
jgi:hypothetical protein